MVLFSSVGAIATEFETTNIDQDLQDRIWNNLQLKVSKDREMRDTFCSFHVNKNGEIAIGLCNNTINVYGSDNQFLYSISFQGTGSYSLEWDEHDLNIYLVRGGIAVEIDSSGNLIEMREIITNSQHNNSYWIKLRNPSKIINDNKYEMRNEHGFLNIFVAQSYSKLVKTDTNGDELVIYDVSSKHRITIIMGVAGVLLLTVTVIFSILGYWKKLKQ